MPTINDRKLVSNIVACIQLYTKLYRQNKDILQTIWTDLCQRLKTDSVIRKTHIDILMHFFDAFSEIQPNLYCDLAVVATIQTLLKSSQRDERKCGYYLFKKIINCFMAASQDVNNISFPAEYSHQIEQSWLSYITILENLEENQSHLILPSLRNLNELIVGKQLQSSWLDILFMRIITHKNNLVLRWSIEFFLNTFTCSELRLDILKLLLEALNSNILYNCEGYFVSKECLMSFFKGDLTNVYVLLGDINWKSIPLHMILSTLHGNDAPKSLTHEQVLRIAPRVRALQDCRIRQATVAVANKLFVENVEKMSMSEYVIYVETLYNSTDKYNVFEQLYKKTQTFDEIIKQVAFKGRFYEILVANIDYTTPEEFTNFLKKIPVAKHGWLKLLPFHFNYEQGSQLLQFTELYGINFIEYITNNPLMKIFDDFDQHLCCDPDDKAECEQRRISAIAFYVHNLQTLDNVSDETFKILFNYKLTEKTIRKLCSCLSTTSTIFDNWIIDNLIELMATVRNEYEE